MKNILTFLLAVLCSVSVSSQNTFTNGSGNGIWNDNGNWSYGHVPNAFDTVVIPAPRTCSIQVDYTGIAKDMEVEDGATMNILGELTLDEFTFGELTSPITGRIWMDRNLGASQVATGFDDADAYGDLYQWGRLTDGHQDRSSETTIDSTASDVPGHDDFIISHANWRDPENTNLWQGVNGINKPCPSGFRLPTDDEWNDEAADMNGYVEAFQKLKLVCNGARNTAGIITGMGENGWYWSSTTSGTDSSLNLVITVNIVTIVGTNRAWGYGVRCIKE